MDNETAKIDSIFYPHIMDRFNRLNENGGTNLVQYTSAEAAMSIIENKEVWLRNVQCMNDYMEVEHGIDCLIQAFRSEAEGAVFKHLMESLFVGFFERFTSYLDQWLPYFRAHTYILCVSEHPDNESKYGRLSMWRAYGGKSPVALVMNNAAFQSESDILATYTYPVVYADGDQFSVDFKGLTKRIKQNKTFIKSLGEETVKYHLFEVFKGAALCIKHPGFKEEKEWRVIYNPSIQQSDYVNSCIESINGIPQKVYKLSLKNLPEHKLTGIEIPELVEKVIIGPTEHQSVLCEAFIDLLTKAGCENANKRVTSSGIPLRQD